MHIIKATEPIEVQHPIFLIYGQPGLGKSSLAYSMRDVLALDFDLGAHRAANRGDTLQVPTWNVVEELMAERTALEPYSALAIDTVGRCLDVLTVDICAKNPKHTRGGGELSLQGFGALKSRWKGWVNQVRALGKDLLIVSHDKEDKDGDRRFVRPDITGGSLQEVLKTADFVGYLSMQGKDRVLDFSPTEAWFGKNPAGWAPFKVPVAAKATAFMGDLYEKGRIALGAISEQHAAAMRALEEWKAAVATYTTAHQFQVGLKEARGITPRILAEQVVALLEASARTWCNTFTTAQEFNDAREPIKAFGSATLALHLIEAADKRNIGFDKTNKAFVAREPQAQPQEVGLL